MPRPIAPRHGQLANPVTAVQVDQAPAAMTADPRRTRAP